MEDVLRILTLGDREWRCRILWVQSGRGALRTATIGSREFNLPRAAENGPRHGLYDVQVVALNPVLVNAVRNLERERYLIRSHQQDRGKPPLERIGV